MTSSSDFGSSTLTDLQEAQREIERLSGVLRQIADVGCGYGSPRGCAEVSRAPRRWCAACMSKAALAAAPVDGAE